MGKTFVGQTFPDPVVPTPSAGGPNDAMNLGGGGGIVGSPFTDAICPVPGGSPASAETSQVQMAPSGGTYGPGPGKATFVKVPGSGMEDSYKE